MAQTIRAAYSLQDDCAKQYTLCVDIAEEILTEFGRVAEKIEQNYAGQGTEMALAAVDKLREHTLLLKDCLANTAAYVEYACGTMQDTDADLAGKMK